MPLANLDDRERDVVRECLRASVEGPFFPEWEFHTLFGIEREEVRSILLSWPTHDDADESVGQAINNSMNNLLGYPIGEGQEAWSRFISVSHEELTRIFKKWRGRPSSSAGSARDYFDNLL